MKTVALGDVCNINPRNPKTLNADEVCSFVPMEYVNDEFGVIVKQDSRRVAEVEKGYTYFGEGDVLFAKITPCMENGKGAIATNLKNGVGFGSTEFHVLRAQKSVTPEWIHYYLRQKSVREDAERNMTGSAGQKRVPSSYLERSQIPLPSLLEQKRLAAILAKADRLRRLRRHGLAVSDTYLQTVFLEIFGKEAAQEWPRVKVSDVAAQKKNAIRTGPFGSQLLHSEFVDEGVAVLGIDNAVENSFAWKQARFITEAKYKQLERYRVFPDDLIITIMGTLGRCAVVPKNIPLAINTKHLCCITLDQSKCLPTYLHSCFTRHRDVLQQLGASERGAIMDGLNMGLIKDITISLPPLPLQQKFAQIVQKHERLRAQQREAARQADGLFQALLHRAFRGKLSPESSFAQAKVRQLF